MSMAATHKPLTGWHVLAMFIAFFGVIFAVNFTMAYLANSTWSGLVVANGYVASQSFDKDLAKARAQEALGWQVAFTSSGDRIRLTFADAAGQKIDGLSITGDLERTVTDKEDQKLTFSPWVLASTAHRQRCPPASGRWRSMPRAMAYPTIARSTASW
jgi:nitrogen fixation protein FixH